MPCYIKLYLTLHYINTCRLLERAIGSVEMVEGLDELSIWLARRVTRLARAINPCFVN